MKKGLGSGDPKDFFGEGEMKQDWFALIEGGLYIIPVLHEKLEFAEAVRIALEEIRPQAVAVELPASLQGHVIRAVARLPKVSVILYESSRGEPLYVPIAPADPLVEGLRWAMDHGVKGMCVDVDVDVPLAWQERLPDSYAASRIGHDTYFRKVLESGLLERATSLDRLRERGMAFRVRRLLGEASPVVLICGMAHAQRIRNDLKGPLAEPMDRRERNAVQVFHLHPESLPEILSEPPIFHAMFEMRRKGLPPEPEEEPLDSMGRSVGSLRVLEGGGERIRDEAKLRAEAVRWCARRCQLSGRIAVEEPISFRELLEGIKASSPEEFPTRPMDRQLAMWRWLQRTSRIYKLKYGSLFQRWQVYTLMRFARNYALVDGKLIPDFFQFVASAKACVDENFAYELWELGCTYPWQKEVAEDLPTTRIRGEDLWLGVRKLRIRPRIFKKRRAVPFPVKRRRKESRPGEWAEAFGADALCSYPPEDVLVERFGSYLKEKGVRLLSDERSRVEPFTSSLLDGIDIRETLRNWHEGRVYVREIRRVRGGVGAVVVIFDHDETGKKYPHCMTWHGEHDQESDMAFYSTPIGENIVGPGISRCEYGGFVMTYPPRRMADIWRDPAYRILESKPEILLAAALDYTLEPNVVYVSSKPPRAWLHNLAAKMGVRIIYIPIGQFSSSTLKKLQVFHILSGHDKRAIAKDYIHKG